MRTATTLLSIAGIVCIFGVGQPASAQDEPAPKPPYTSEAMLKRISAAAGQDSPSPTCTLASQGERPLDSRVTVDGVTYRCLQVLDQNLQPGGIWWTVMPVYTSEAMLRRIGGDITLPANAAATPACRLPDQTGRSASTTVTVEGRTYRCVEVADPNLERRGAAWIPVPQPFR